MAGRDWPSVGLLSLKVEMVEFGHSQNVAWPILSGAKWGSSDCRLAVASLATTGWCMVKGLHLATVRICDRDRRRLAIDSTLVYLRSFVGSCRHSENWACKATDQSILRTTPACVTSSNKVGSSLTA